MVSIRFLKRDLTSLFSDHLGVAHWFKGADFLPKFACVHKIYGASNLTKMLQQHVPVHLRPQAANSLSFEAHVRVQDPVYGCVGIIHQLQHEIYMTQYELAKIQAHLAIYDAQMLPPTSQAHDPLQQDSRFGIYTNRSELITATHQTQIAPAAHEVGKSELPHIAGPSLAEALGVQVEQAVAPKQPQLNLTLFEFHDVFCIPLNQVSDSRIKFHLVSVPQAMISVKEKRWVLLPNWFRVAI
ncbi:hypothetical protein ACLOJK_030772 [Asimina triloba]